MRRGVTIIEVLVVMGILLILAALALPTIASTRRRAIDAKWLAMSSQNAKLIIMYTQEWKDAFPFVKGDSVSAALSWHKPLLKASFVEKQSQLDGSKSGWTNFMMNQAMVYDAIFMQPSVVLPQRERIASAQRMASVKNPSGLGVLSVIAPRGEETRYIKETGSNGPNTWCCIPSNAPIGPVAFVDGSAILSRWTELYRAHEKQEFGIGLPASSTWYGLNGRDR